MHAHPCFHHDAWIDAHVVPCKGTQHDYPIKALAEVMEIAGFNNLILKSDNEPAIKALKRAAIHRVRERFNVNVQPEESKEYSSQTNGVIERAIWSVEGLV